MKVVIIDDESKSRQVLIKMLNQSFGKVVEIVAEADSVKSGIEILKNHQPDLVYLDIKMPDGTGFELLEKLSKVNFEVIFITAHNEYAIHAFNISAIGYLLKPISIDQFVKTTQKAIDIVDKDRKSVKVLIENYRNGIIKKIAIPNNDGLVVCDLEDVLYIEADVNYSYFYLLDGRKLISGKTIRSYEELLFNYGFFRIHKSYIVNLRYVTEYKKSINTIVLTNNNELPIARLRKQEFQNLF